MSSLFDLSGKTALVTGGTGVLGEAIARGLGAAGARVLIATRAIEKAEARIPLYIQEGITARAIAMNVCDRASTEAAIAALDAEWSRIDILVNAAGGNQPGATAMPPRTFFDLDVDALRQVVDLNLFGGALIPSMVVGKAMSESGHSASIINITSASAVLPLTRVAGYSASKAAVQNFTQWLAVHFARDLRKPIRVNALMPGFFLTEQNRFLLTKEDGSRTDRGETIISQTPMGRFGLADDLVGAALFLASDASAFVTGSTVVVDGGFTAFAGV